MQAALGVKQRRAAHRRICDIVQMLYQVLGPFAVTERDKQVRLGVCYVVKLRCGNDLQPNIGMRGMKRRDVLA